MQAPARPLAGVLHRKGWTLLIYSSSPPLGLARPPPARSCCRERRKSAHTSGHGRICVCELLCIPGTSSAKLPDMDSDLTVGSSPAHPLFPVATESLSGTEPAGWLRTHCALGDLPRRDMRPSTGSPSSCHLSSSLLLNPERQGQLAKSLRRPSTSLTYTKGPQSLWMNVLEGSLSLSLYS